MNEKEKMLHGENYNAEDKELKKDRRHARQVCFEYNNTPPADAEKMQKIMSSLLGKHGKNCGIRAPFIAITDITSKWETIFSLTLT